MEYISIFNARLWIKRGKDSGPSLLKMPHMYVTYKRIITWRNIFNDNSPYPSPQNLGKSDVF